MAIDRNTIVTLDEKGESNSCIAKKMHIRRETVWKVVKKFKETGEACNRPGCCKNGMNFQPLMNV